MQQANTNAQMSHLSVILQHGWHHQAMQADYPQLLSRGFCTSFSLSAFIYNWNKHKRHFSDLLQGGWDYPLSFKRINLFLITGHLSLPLDTVATLSHLTAISAQWHSTVSFLKNSTSSDRHSDWQLVSMCLSIENCMQSMVQFTESIRHLTYRSNIYMSQLKLG